MNINEAALTTYISATLHTIVEKFDAEQKHTDTFCNIYDFKNPIFKSEDNIRKILSYTNRSCPAIICINNELIYTIISTASFYYLIGPVKLDNNIVFKNRINSVKLISYSPDNIYICEWSVYYNIILLTHNLFHKKQNLVSDIIKENSIYKNLEKNTLKNFTNTVFENTEVNKTHNPYEQELREQAAIEAGDIALLKKSIQEIYNGEVGTLAKDTLRNIKNLGIVVITLASRTAIKGGVSPEISFSLSDAFIQKLEELNDINTVMHFIRETEFQYTQMVHNIIETKNGTINKIPNPKIKQCKDYIYSHLHDKLSVQNIAAVLNTNANYLSEIFKKYEGISLSRYIMNEKIARAKNLLIYSDYSYIEIAAYLGFSSQSHMSTQFKKCTGYTPKEYRYKYGITQQH